MKKQLDLQRNRDYSLVPNFEQIVQCEERVLEFYQWDIKFFLPIHFIRCFLANGIMFVNEFNEKNDDQSTSLLTR